MVKWFFPAGLWRAAFWTRAGLGLVTAAWLCMPSWEQAQSGLFSHNKKHAPQAEAKPAFTSSQPPAFEIPVGPLGFFAPGAIYQGQRDSLASLDFLDENRLLFTFHAPGLMRRNDKGDDSLRQIRAVVLTLPQGTITAEALWTLHDRGRYVWMLNDGHFVLRDQNDLQLGDRTLELKPKFHFRGPILWLEIDPTQQWLVTDSREIAESKRSVNDVPSPASALATITSDAPEAADNPDIILRILRRTTGQVMLMSHVRSTVHLPVNNEGYLETLRGKGREWVLNLNYFTGGSRIIGKIDSVCSPSLEFVSQNEVLVTTCNPDGSHWLVGMAIDGRHLWNAASPRTEIWPRLVMAPDGLRLARESLLVTHPVDALSPLSFDDVKGQLVEVYDAADGRLALKAQASPVLDGGGNVAISPSGKRVAIVNGGAIQVYELPLPAALPLEAKPAV